MTAAEFREIREASTMTQAELAKWLGVSGFRVVQRYEAGERRIAGPIAKLMTLLSERGASK